MPNLKKYCSIAWVVVFSFLLVGTSIAEPKTKLVEVTANKLNVRAHPSIKSPIIDQVKKGDRLIVSYVSNNWAEISPYDGTSGYISTKYISMIERKNNSRGSTSALVAFLFIAIPAFLFVAFRSQTDKKQAVKRDSRDFQTYKEIKIDVRTPLDRKESVTEGVIDNPKATSNVRRNFQSTYRTQACSLIEARKKIQEFPVARVEHVIDGDTVIVSNAWKITKIRLDSIDCPENGQHWGDIATAGLIKIIGGKRIRIEAHGNDHYGRLLATLYVQNEHRHEWVNVNESMVIKGHAWVMRKYYDHLPKDRRDNLTHLEKWARIKKVGLWKTPNPIPPWKWRSKL